MNGDKDSRVSQFQTPTGGQLILTVIVLAVFSLAFAGEDLIKNWTSDVEDSLSIGAVLEDFVFYMIMIPILPVPILLLVWNLLAAPVFNAPRLKYAQALVLYALLLLLHNPY